MARTPEEKRAYARGYNIGRCNGWPKGLPDPPSRLVAEVLAAALEMVGGVDALYSTCFTDEDEEELDTFGLYAASDKVFESIGSMSTWLRENACEEPPKGEDDVP